MKPFAQLRNCITLPRYDRFNAFTGFVSNLLQRQVIHFIPNKNLSLFFRQFVNHFSYNFFFFIDSGTASCPHAALMSWPELLRTMTVISDLRNASANASIRGAGVGLSEAPIPDSNEAR